MLRDEDDYDSYFEDTMRAGHYENRKETVDIMIRSSREVIDNLVEYGVEFEHRQKNTGTENAGTCGEKMDSAQGEGAVDNGTIMEDEFAYTREGAHSRPRILFHEDITGKEITSKLLDQVKKLENVTLYEYTEMKDILVEEGVCAGILAERADGGVMEIRAGYTIFATGGIGGLYEHSTNFPHLTGDAVEIAKRHGIRLEHLDYVQFHPTTLYSEKPGRRFLISESVRGEGAVLYNKRWSGLWTNCSPGMWWRPRSGNR